MAELGVTAFNVNTPLAPTVRLEYSYLCSSSNVVSTTRINPAAGTSASIVPATIIAATDVDVAVIPPN